MRVICSLLSFILFPKHLRYSVDRTNLCRKGYMHNISHWRTQYPRLNHLICCYDRFHIILQEEKKRVIDFIKRNTQIIITFRLDPKFFRRCRSRKRSRQEMKRSNSSCVLFLDMKSENIPVKSISYTDVLFAPVFHVLNSIQKELLIWW